MKIAIDIKSGEIRKDDSETKHVIVGIDLGTTNSIIAYMDGEAPKTILGADKSAIVPSVIHFDENGNPEVGTTAKSYLIDDPSNTIYSIKRLMGRSYQDVTGEVEATGYDIVANEDTEALVKVRVKDRYYSPIELSAIILKELKQKAEKHLQTIVSQAVITVPAYFNDTQRQATRDAGKLAGLDVLRIVNEPTAASLAYGLGVDREQSNTVAVYDLGGGTFDISILTLEDGIFEVLSTHGDTHLGGDDFDRAIVDYWIESLGLSADIVQNKSMTQVLRTHAEKAKKALSTKEVYEVKHGDYQFKVERSTFENLIQPLIDRTISSCKQAVKDAKVDIKSIDKVILVGGSTRVPAVKSAVASYFQQAPDDNVNPDEVVAQGAAVQADILAGNRKDLLLLDVTPLSLGIETVGGLMDTIIPRNSKVPTRAGRQYTTSVDGQTNLKVAVYQGERELVQDNRKLGEFILKNIPPMPAGIPKIEIKFILDADGILTVKAEELRSSTQATVEIKSTYSITEEEMGHMLLESIKNAEEDMKIRSVKEAINEAQNVLNATQKFVDQNKAILSEEEIKNLQRYKSSLEQAIQSNQKDVIQKGIEELNNYSTPLAHRALDHNIQQSLKGKTIV